MTPATATQEPTMYVDLPLADIVRNPAQPRKHFDPDALAELAASIAANGLLEPILVRPVGTTYVIVAGERRWRASTAAGLTDVACRVLDIGEEDAYVLSVAENVNRADMTVLEETDAFAQLVAYGRTHDNIAHLFGKSVTYVETRLSFAALVDDAKTLLTRGEIRPWLARYLARCSPGNQRTVLNRFARGEFKNETETAQFAKALFEAEGDIGFFMVEETTEEAREIHKAKAAAARRTLDKIEALSAALAEFAGATPEDLAAVLGDELVGRLESVERITFAALGVRENLRNARAIAAARQLVVRDEVQS